LPHSAVDGVVCPEAEPLVLAATTRLLAKEKELRASDADSLRWHLNIQKNP
jgi:hypothetical protein